jgi:hypothetical protein
MGRREARRARRSGARGRRRRGVLRRPGLHGPGRDAAAQRDGPRGSFAAGYRSGRESAFSAFDGGWSYGAPYIVTLRRGGPGITYRFARRWPMTSGVEYRICGRKVCTRRTP